MCRLTFHEPRALDITVKRLLSQHGLYHIVEPHTVGNTVYYVVKGPVESINAFRRDYEPVLEQHNRQVAKAKRWLWLRRLFGYALQNV